MSVHEKRVSNFKGIQFTYRSEKEYLEQYAKAQRQWYRWCLENRICPKCETKLPDSAKRKRCDTCSEIVNARKRKGVNRKLPFEFTFSGVGSYQSEYKKALRQWCRDNGLCTACAKQPSVEGQSKCESCKNR